MTINRWTEAHARLLAALPVHTHVRPDPRPPATDGKRGPSGDRAVRIGRDEYPSISEACRKLKIHPRTFYKWLDAGSASYL